MSTPIEVNDQNFEAEVLKSDIPVLVDFWAPWCGPCKMVAPVLEAISAKYAGKIKVVKLNTDENPTIAGQYQITGIPSLLVMKDGNEAKRMVGFQPEAALEQELQAYVS